MSCRERGDVFTPTISASGRSILSRSLSYTHTTHIGRQRVEIRVARRLTRDGLIGWETKDDDIY